MKQLGTFVRIFFLFLDYFIGLVVFAFLMLLITMAVLFPAPYTSEIFLVLLVLIVFIAWIVLERVFKFLFRVSIKFQENSLFYQGFFKKGTIDYSEIYRIILLRKGLYLVVF